MRNLIMHAFKNLGDFDLVTIKEGTIYGHYNLPEGFHKTFKLKRSKSHLGDISHMLVITNSKGYRIVMHESEPVYAFGPEEN